ncbi:capsule assembly protein Wzi [Larkinella arboricola]|uniref:Capsule assembly protein Wzi n=1 Tax=Larkinella arboricola TaxID=643671 RepID=A0A327WKX2_LARAB|nr:capsule assembly Wzi family protein [Larkinella arboricola]RAJ92559.1 capsule assembly protein Wzi [Larkinella arboricola]
MKRLCILVVGWLGMAPGWAQTAATSWPFKAELELGSMASSSDRLPFWLRTNQYGMVPLQVPFATLRGGIRRDYRTDSTTTHPRRFDWGAGAYAVANVGETRQGLLPELYVKVRYGQLELWAGRHRELYGIGDSTLSSGFVIWSGNALPIPKVQLQTPDFVPIGGFLKKTVAFRVGYAHGWFNAPYIKGALFHQKYIYGRFGKPHWPFKLYAGLNHQVQWGGHADYLIGSPFAVYGHLPSSFQDYISLVLGRYPKDLVNNQQTTFDGENRVGNHIGSIDYALEWITPRLNTLLYYQHLYEDASGVVLINFPDGLWGIRVRNRAVGPSHRFRWKSAVVEWLTTTNQSGPVFDQTAQFQGSDNYFNHGQYREGWSYFGRTIGTPFIAPRADYTPRVREYVGGGFFPNNRIHVWYLGMEAAASQVQFSARASFSRNYGSFNEPYAPPFEQFSALLSAQCSLPRLTNTALSMSIAYDQGGLYPKQTGGFLSIKRSW